MSRTQGLSVEMGDCFFGQLGDWCFEDANHPTGELWAMSSARVINCKAIARALRATIKSDVQTLTETHGRVRSASVG